MSPFKLPPALESEDAYRSPLNINIPGGSAEVQDYSLSINGLKCYREREQVQPLKVQQDAGKLEAVSVSLSVSPSKRQKQKSPRSVTSGAFQIMAER
jgi:hypothetical protein